MRMHFNIKSLISMMFAMMFSFVALFSFPVQASEPLLTGSYSTHRSAANTSTANFNIYGYGEFNNFKPFFDEYLEPGCFYKVKYDAEMTLELDKAGVLNGQSLSFRFFKDSDNLYQHVKLLNQTGKLNCDAATQYVFSDSGYFIIFASDISSSSYEFFFDFNYAVTTGVLTYKTNITLDITDIVKLSDSESEIYQRAFYEGYNEGEEVGYNQGYSNGHSDGYSGGYQQGQADSVGAGYDDGYQDGFDDGVDEGYQSGKDDGFDDGYDVGFDAGAGSVNTDQYYQDGFDAGVDSIDTDSYYAAGFEAGLSSGYQDAYNTGYSEGVSFGYAEGYAAARQNVNDHLTNTGTSSGEMFQVKYKVDENKNALSLTDSNTTLPVAFEYVYGEDYEFDYEYEYENPDWEFDEFSFKYYYFEDRVDTEDGEGLGEIEGITTDYFGEVIDETYFKEVTKKFEKWRGYGYYYMAPVKLFTADTSAYAYKITLYQDSTKYTGSNINWIRNTVGEWSDIMSGDSDLGLGFYHGAGGQFTYIIKTDNLPVDIYSALLMYYYCDQSNAASFDLESNLTFDITPYTRNEFAGIMSNIDDLQGDINDRFGELEENLNQNFDDLMHSYDTSKGDLVNDNFQASLNEYENAENSLFNTATESLGAYEFFDFNSVPAMITGISFVTSVMTSIYNALGGVSGASGIILSILFSVMLVSMVLGLSRLYQSASRRSAHKNSSKPTRTKNDHIKK